MVYTVFFGDILYNFVVQHRKSEEKVTEYIKESTIYYLKTQFLVDLLSNLMFITPLILEKEACIGFTF